MAYANITWSQLQSMLVQRLDQNQIFYTNTGTFPEVTLWLKEALRAWNLATASFRERLTFTLTPGVFWYDLRSITTMPASMLNETITDRDCIAEIQYHFLEPATGSTWTGSDMFSLSNIITALQKRRDQFILETGIEQERYLQSFTPTVDGRFTLSDDTIDIRRVGWWDTLSRSTPVWRSDEWAADANLVGWASSVQHVPYVYSIIKSPPLTVQLIPPPDQNGDIDLLATYEGDTLNPLAPVKMGVPDDVAWAVKWGAMADLLAMENQARDPMRADYCEQRYQEGVALAQVSPLVLGALVDGDQASICSIMELDSQSPGWENVTPAQPLTLGITNYMLATYPPPDAAYVVTLDVCRPAPIPATGASYIQVGLEEANAILDYAQHIALFKEGGQDFTDSQTLYRNFARMCSLKNGRLNANAIFRWRMEGQEDLEAARRKRKEDK